MNDAEREHVESKGGVMISIVVENNTGRRIGGDPGKERD